MKTLKILFTLTILFIINGCSYHQMDSHSVVCSNLEIEAISAMLPDENGEIQKVDFKINPSITGWYDEPIRTNAFWVRVTGHNKGRKWRTRHTGWKSGDEGIPMLYSTEYAYVEKPDGSMVPAASEMYFTNDKEATAPGKRIDQSVVDLNSDKLHFSNKVGNYMYPSIYIRFDTLPPVPGDEWVIHLGKVQIGDELIDIPSRRLCMREGFAYIDWGVSFRP